MTQPLAFQNVERLQVLCLLQGDRGIAPEADQERLCNAVARLAEDGAELPVAIIPIGDPQVVAPGGLTLLVHGALTDAYGGKRLAFTVRPYRPSVAGSDVLFGAMPRLADFTDDAALEAAVAASLNEVLPWRDAGRGVRPIN